MNERIRLAAQPFGEISGDETRADFVCECSDETCSAVVAMSVAEWKAATTEASYFVVRPEHTSADDQAVVATDRYAVVRSARPGEPAYSEAEAGALERP